ncbi:hypothetical protein FV218_06465 [Methylobacterium sp. WL69]|uniref:hypothetical protein n=1 Tax=Methylobacterium sp. WL69 TaxID=2603893 RepID=UPI0011DB1E3F|nr:hypothetical protein [Methylobacterium sp. WL69]TXM76586.1 hypothetical protein FV218_06465 [Methylobacterium sp. WL69]
MEEIAASPRNVLWASARTDLCDEQAEDLHKLVIEHGRQMNVMAVHSAQPKEKGSVSRRISAALENYVGYANTALMITHESLFRIETRLLERWHVVIDEVPTGCVSSGRFSAPVTWKSLEFYYDLLPTSVGNRYLVRCRDGIDQITASMISAEASEVSMFHKLASNRNRKIFVDIASWEDAKSLTAPVKWWSVWTPVEIHNAASIAIAGSGYFKSLICRASEKLGVDIVYETIKKCGGSFRSKQKWSIHYYTRHTGSTIYWQEPDGRKGLAKISQHLESIGFEGYWASNSDIENFFFGRLDGVHCLPKQACTNSLRHHESCAYIYSNKAQDSDAPIMEILDIDSEDVLASREHEDIIQFVMRGKARESTYDGHYNVYLYSLDQAEMLKDYLEDNCLAGEVNLIAEENAGLIDVIRPRKKAEISLVSRRISQEELTVERRKKDAVRKHAARERSRAAAIMEGNYKPPGRPRKSL